MEGEVGRSAGAITNLGLKRSTGSAAATDGGTNIVVGGHGAAFAFKTFTIDGHLAIVANGNFGVQDHVVVEREFVNGIVAFRNLGEGQRVVVVQHGRRNLRRNATIGEVVGNSAEVVSLLPHIRDGGVVHLNHEGPDVGCAIAFGDGHKLALDEAGKCGVGGHAQFDVIVANHLEGQFLTFNAEQAIARGEIKNGHRVGRAIAVHGESEGFHPSVGRTGAKIQLVNNLGLTVHVSHMETVANRSATTAISESGLGQEVALVEGSTGRAGSVVTTGRSTSDTLAIPVGAAIRTRLGLIDAHEQVATIVMVRRVEINSNLDFATCGVNTAFVNHGSTRHANIGTQGGAAHFRQIDLEGGRAPRVGVSTRLVERQTGNVCAGHFTQLISGINHLASGVVVHPQAIERNITVGGSTIMHSQFLRPHKASNGKQERHHQRKYFLFHNELIW